MAEETIPISRATARSFNPAAPSVASWLRAISVISRVSSSRTRSRAVRLAFTLAILAEDRHEPRALLWDCAGRAPFLLPRRRTGAGPARFLGTARKPGGLRYYGHTKS